MIVSESFDFEALVEDTMNLQCCLSILSINFKRNHYLM